MLITEREVASFLFSQFRFQNRKLTIHGRRQAEFRFDGRPRSRKSRPFLLALHLHHHHHLSLSLSHSLCTVHGYWCGGTIMAGCCKVGEPFVGSSKAQAARPRSWEKMQLASDN
jgi:hypothetical protein